MTGTFQNPINHGPDPWLLYFQSFYYLTTTQHNCLRMWKASTLAGLAEAEPVLIWQDDNPSRNQQVWAAEFHRFGECWYMYYTASDGNDRHHQIYVLESEGDDPMGPYHFKAQITDEWAIDPGILSLPDGRLYFLWTSSEDRANVLSIAPMSNPWTISDPKVVISRPTLPWERHGFPVNEAPEILQKNGQIFLIYSACDTGTPDYCLGMLTASVDADLLNPESWQKSPEPVFSRSDADGVYGPGHNGFFSSPDGTEDWIVYHARTSPTFSYEGRITRAQRFHWNDDGTPNFGQPVPLGVMLAAPSGE